MPDFLPSAVIITRPLAQAAELAERVRAMGRTAIIFPLLEIHPLTDTAALRAALARLHEFALVAFVSPNAIDATFAQLDYWPLQTPLAVMGEGSRRALARHGVTSDRFNISSPQDTVRTDSETLLQQLDLSQLRGRRVLILRGESGREWLADALRNAGIEVEQVAAYRRTAPAMTEARRQQLRQLLQQPNDWLISSSEALRILLDAAAQVDPEQSVAKLQHQNWFAPHPRIADVARAAGLQSIHLTHAGDDGLLTALQFGA